MYHFFSGGTKMRPVNPVSLKEASKGKLKLLNSTYLKGVPDK